MNEPTTRSEGVLRPSSPLSGGAAGPLVQQILLLQAVYSQLAGQVGLAPRRLVTGQQCTTNSCCYATLGMEACIDLLGLQRTPPNPIIYNGRHLGEEHRVTITPPRNIMVA